MREDLDERVHLVTDSQQAIATPVATTESAVVDPSFMAILELATPWRRFWARNLDFVLWLCLIDFPIAWFAPGALDGSFSMLTYFATLPVIFVLDAGVYFLCGNTPGKSLAGVRVLDENGMKVGFIRYLNRNFRVCLQGLGLGTVFAIFTMSHAYSKLRAQETLSWDEKAETRVFQVRPGAWRSWLVGSLYIGILAALSYCAIFMKSPQNQIQLAVTGINLGTPKMIDEITRFDGAQALPDVTMQYNYTNLSEEADDADQAYRERFEGEMSKQVGNLICDSDELKPLRDLGTTFRFRYSNRFGGLIALISVPSKECAMRSKD